MPIASLREAAAAAAGGQAYPSATLYVVATPIGNLADLTLRAIYVLGLVDAIACEDTRHSGPLLRQLGIDKPLLAVHDHNEREAAAGVLSRLAVGERVAYVSDAGTPAISDPGAALVAAARSAGYRAMPIPGASSVVTALSVAGDGAGAATGFAFVGFLPAKAGERAGRVATVIGQTATQVLFEAPHRIEALAKALAAACPDRTLTVCRELTKQFESVVTLSAGQWPAHLQSQPHAARGEFVVVMHALRTGFESADTASLAEERALQSLMKALPLKQAVAIACELTGAPRNRLYQTALRLKAAGPAARAGDRTNDDDDDGDCAPTIDT